MKKLMSLSFFLILFSCSEESTETISNSPNITSSSNKEIIYDESMNEAKLHSETLDYLYGEISKNDKNVSSIEKLDEAIGNMFLISDFDNNDLDILNSHIAYSKNENLPELDEKLLSKKILHEEFLSEISNLKDISETSVKNILFSEKYESLDDESFKEMSLVAGVFVDSYNYWQLNMDKWSALGYFTDSEKDPLDITSGGFMKYVNKDANGVTKMLLISAVMTAASGGTGVVVTVPALLVGAAISSAFPW